MKLDVQVKNDCVSFGDDFSIRFQRTLRIPDDGRTYPLPPGLGAFPVRRVDDYKDRVPAEWVEQGGVFLPMYQREAMWLSFGSLVPHAVKIAVGKVCALTGKSWSESLHEAPQDYLVAPPQPWLDGIAVGDGRIKQFIAMPLGMGYTVEGQVTGEERFGGIQIKVHAPKAGRFRKVTPPAATGTLYESLGACPPPPCCAAPAPAGPYRSSSAPKGGRARGAGSMGLAAGGSMEQKVYPDPHGIDSWDLERSARVFVHIVNSELWREITGERPPESPVTAKEYKKHGLPWFELYDEHLPTLGGTSALKQVKSVKELDQDKSALPLQDDDSVEPGVVKKLYLMAKHMVRDGQW
ncbi:MAG: hypothetical protein AMXMBFR56_80950 [Polyangiaceae bacterium]